MLANPSVKINILPPLFVLINEDNDINIEGPKQVIPNEYNFVIIFFNLSIFNFIGFKSDFPNSILFFHYLFPHHLIYNNNQHHHKILLFLQKLQYLLYN